MLAVAMKVGGEVPSVRQAAVPKEAAVFRDWTRVLPVSYTHLTLPTIYSV